jgi:3'-phosphoadenosine 5'-phosphosulfate sulfotransferase
MNQANFRNARGTRGKVHRTRPDKAAAQLSNHYHVGDYGLRGDTLGNAKGGSEA